MNRFKVGVLGATGAVGQKFIRLLAEHPWFEITAVAASSRSAGKRYDEAAHWIEPIPVPPQIAGMVVRECDPAELPEVDFVFSGMDAAVAGEIERKFAEAGIPVVTNARNYRREAHVPLLVPEVNPDHIAQIQHQTFDPNGRGFIVTNPNCVCVPLVLSLKPLADAFGIDSVVVTSMQAVSGAGYPGVPSLDIMGNVVPYIGGEEEKIMWEPLKLLGDLQADGTVRNSSIGIHASAYRVPVIEGHLLSVLVKLAKADVTEAQAREVYDSWVSPLAGLQLPSAPVKPVLRYDEPRYPQPRLHAPNENGMQVTMGRLRKAGLFDFAYTALGHNTIRGAAGGAVLNAELLVAKEIIRPRN
ncbi:MAG: aspartate-semialdehyde dehydrogenase [Candidatus Cyclonatronum sp.]|uniref:aspartate-semialdehyde dehydrogenase n=1 Tax=Cyclonatronum sp. TaxID=3024185 RepID=UPI0025BC1DBF|nr:aspartate-semialdehyde dehydrogenase [Cyclonatronum sp.]MCC5935270.1 aspartate-semialdehyde dehydrogenase [Balneolales bacterium]MCH8487699.1 aspartate-semialdehyde dehydrogenase [Cyclonatronum sp.]